MHNSDQSRAIEQAKAGYQNAQELVRFIDTKSTFLAGASVASLGFSLQLIKYFFELPANIQNQIAKLAVDYPICLCSIQVLGPLSLLFGVLCLWSCILSLVGRNPIEIRLTILFPFFGGAATEKEYCRKIVQGMTESEVAQEYENQILNMGIIVKRKITRHRNAAWMFLAQIAMLTVSAIILAVLLRV